MARGRCELRDDVNAVRRSRAPSNSNIGRAAQMLSARSPDRAAFRYRLLAVADPTSRSSGVKAPRRGARRAPMASVPSSAVTHLSAPIIATVWFRGRPYPVSAYPHGPTPTGSSWYVLLGDGQWYPVCERRLNEAGGHGPSVEADVIAWLAQNDASGSTRPLETPGGATYKPGVRDAAVKVASLAFESGWHAADFLRRLNTLFDGRMSRLIIPSTPVVVFGPTLIDANVPVTLYAGRGALSLARYVGVTFPSPGAEVDAATLVDVDIVFGALPRLRHGPAQHTEE